MTIHVQRRPAWATLLAVVALGAPAAAQDGRVATRLPSPAPANRSSIDVPKVRYTEFTLPNGLRVLLHEDHSSPIVALEMWYSVGGKHDPKGKSGLAHMFEHMMDEGTLNMPSGEFKRVIQSAGGSYNATTSNDWTRYHMTLPSNHLETGLWLEAERMANLSPTLDENRFKLERDAVRNEYRDRILSTAVMSAAEALFEGLFPTGSYAPPLFGYQGELDTATVSDLRKFYDTYYVPNNAVLAIAGDFDVADARRKIEKHFSAIPRGRIPARPNAAGRITGEKRLVVEHPTGVRQVWVAWRGANSGASDRPAAMALASILTERLRKLLVDERRVSIVINPAFNANFDLVEAGVLQSVITLTPAASATEVEQVVDSVVASIKTNGVTDTEVRRWVASYRMRMLTDMQSAATKGSYLADGAMNSGSPMAIFNTVETAQRLTPAAVQAAARKYLTGDRVVLSLVPTGKLDLMSKPNLPYVNATRK